MFVYPAFCLAYNFTPMAHFINMSTAVYTSKSDTTLLPDKELHSQHNETVNTMLYIVCNVS